MKKKHPQPLTPAALYARVSSDRQDVDLSVSAQLRALKDYARANGCAPRHAAWDTRLNREKFGGDFWANRPTLKRKLKRKTACR